MEIENPWLMRIISYCNPLAAKGLRTAKTVKSDIRENYEQLMIAKKDALKVISVLTLECSRKD